MSLTPTLSTPRGLMARTWLLAALLLLAPAVIRAQTLVQTINLAQQPGTAALTSIAVDPGINRVYVADGATTNVYFIDGATNSVTATVYTADFGTGTLTPTPPQFGVDGTPLGPGYSPNVVLANPVTHTWVWMGQSEGIKFNGTAFDELIAGKAMHLGGAWDPVTDNMYFADGQDFFWAVNNLKMLFVGFPCFASNAVAVNSMTDRVYVSSSCGSVIAYDGASFTGFKNPAPQPLAAVGLGGQASGLAVNPNTNRIYAAMVDAGALEVIDGSTYQVLASIPGLAPPNTNGATTTLDFLDRRAVSIAVNTLTNTIYAVNPGNSTVSIFDGNTNTLVGTITTPDGAVAVAVNEQTNTLYVANSAGTVSVYSLDPPAAPTFSASGIIRDTSGVAQPGVNVTAAGANGTASAVTDASGLFVLTGLGSGNYTVTPSSPSFSFASQLVTINGGNVGGLAFTANPPIVPVSYTLGPWNMIGAGATTTGTVTLNQPAPAGGAVVALSASDTKSAKFPATVTVPAGQTQVSFSVQGSGVSTPVAVRLTASYNGGAASTSLTVAPSDSVKITKATWSKSSQVLTVTVTGSNPQATLVVQNGKSGAALGTMVNQGGGSYSYQQTISSGSLPSSVNVISNLGGKTGQGITVIN